MKLQQLWRAYGEAERWPCLFVWSTYLVTLDEIGDVANLDVLLTLNGEEMQSANTSRLIFDVPTIIATVSEFTTLEIGDVILTGTPGGVGFRRDPKVLLKDGDELTVDITGLGTLMSRMVTEIV